MTIYRYGAQPRGLVRFAFVPWQREIGGQRRRQQRLAGAFRVPGLQPETGEREDFGGRLALGGDGLARQRQSLKGRLVGIGHQQRQACPLGVGQLGMKRAVGREFVARRLQALLEHRAIRQARYVEAAIEQADEVGAGIGVFCSQRASILRDLGGIELHVCYPVSTRDGKSC